MVQISKPQSLVKRLFKWMAWGCLSLAILLIGLLCALPTLASTPWLQTKLIKYINTQIPGNLSVQSMQLSWFGGQKIEGIELKDDKDQTIMRLANFSTDASLFQILKNKGANNLKFSNLELLLLQEANGTTNLQNALTGSDSKDSTTTEPHVEIQLKDVNGQFDTLSSKDSMTWRLSGSTMQNNVAGDFEIDIFLADINSEKILELKEDWDKILKTNEHSHIKLKIKTTHFPVSLLDQAMALKEPKLAGVMQAALGDHVDVLIDQTVTSGGTDFKVNVKAPNLIVDMLGKYESDQLTLAQPASIIFTATPELISQLSTLNPNGSPIQLKKPTQIKLNVTSIFIPFNWKTIASKKFDLSEAALSANFEMDQADLNDDMLLGSFSLREFRGKIEAPKGTVPVLLTLNGEANHNGQPVQVAIESKFEKSLQIADTLKSYKNGGYLHVELSNLPMTLADKFSGQNQTFSELLGPVANLSLTTFSQDGKANLDLKLKSDRLTIPQARFQIGKELVLMEPANIQYTMGSEFLNRYLLEEQSVKLHRDIPLSVQLKNLRIPIPETADEEFAFQPNRIKVDAEISATGVVLPEINPIGQIDINDLLVIIKGKSLADMQAITTLNIHQPAIDGFIHSMVGSNTQIKLDNKLSVTPLKNILLTDFKAEMKSDLAHGKFQGRIIDNSQVLLTSPSIITYTLTPAALKTMGVKQEIQNPTPVYLTINPHNTPFGLDHLSTMHFSGELRLEHLALNASGKSLSIQQLFIPWDINGSANQIRMDISGKTTVMNQEGGLQGKLFIQNWQQEGKISFNDYTTSGKVTLSDFPTSFFDIFSDKKEMVTLLGQTINMTLEMKISKQENSLGNFDLVVQGEDFDAYGSFAIGDVITLKDTSKPATLRYKMTSERFAAFQRLLNDSSNQIALTNQSEILAKMTSLDLPWKKILEPEQSLLTWSQLGLTADVMIDQLDLKNYQSSKHLKINQINANLSSPKLENKIDFSMNAQQPHHSGTSNDLEITGSVENILTTNGEFNTSGLSLSLHANLNQFPVKLISGAVGISEDIQNKIEALIGETFDADIRIQLQKMKGPIVARVSGNNGNIFIDGALANQIFTLNKDFIASFTLTPKLGNSILVDVFPLFSGVVGADNSLNILIKADGFAVPISPFDISTVQVRSAVLDMGKVHFSNNGRLADVLSLLNINENVISIWFTPLYLRMNEGVLTLERVDFLVSNRYPLATWGKVNFVKDKVSMVIGLTGQAIKGAFNISGLDNNYIMQLPLKGKTGKVSIDKAKAATKIGILIAKSQGTQGLVIGTVMDIASGGLSEDKVPQPTTNPLPWTSQMDSSPKNQQQQPAQQQTDRKTRDEASVNEVKKEVKSILKNFFK